MKLAIVALGFSNNDKLRCEVQDPTLLFQTVLVARGVIGIYGAATPDGTKTTFL